MKFTVEVRIRVTDIGVDEVLQLNQQKFEQDLWDIMPGDGPLDMSEMRDFQQKIERRQRFTDMLSSSMAHAVTNGLFDLATKRRR